MEAGAVWMPDSLVPRTRKFYCRFRFSTISAADRSAESPILHPSLLPGLHEAVYHLGLCIKCSCVPPTISTWWIRKTHTWGETAQWTEGKHTASGKISVVCCNRVAAKSTGLIPYWDSKTWSSLPIKLSLGKNQATANSLFPAA